MVDLHGAGKGYKKISKELGVHRSTVRKTIYKWKKFGTIANLPRSGCPPKDKSKRQCAVKKEVEKTTVIKPI